MSQFEMTVRGIAIKHRTPPPMTSVCSVIAAPGTDVSTLEKTREIASAGGDNVVWHATSANPDALALRSAVDDMAARIGKLLGAAPTKIQHNDVVYLYFCATLPPDASWEKIVEDAAQASSLASIVVPAVQPVSTWLSFAPMSGTEVVDVDVDVAQVAVFLQALGDALLVLGIPDVQVWAQRRSEKGENAPVEAYGIIVDVDKTVDDVLDAIHFADIPMPTAYWRTLHGYKLLFCSDNPISVDDMHLAAGWLVAAIDGADPASTRVSQGQHLPIVLKNTEDGPIEVPFDPVQGNAIPFRLDQIPFEKLPRALAIVFGGHVPLSEGERAIVEQYLIGLGLAPPDEPGGKTPYAACPACAVHDSRKCCVWRRLDGSFFVTCLGGHDGRGKLRWTEHDLLRLAHGDHSTESGRFDPIRTLPATWADKEYRAFRIREAYSGWKFVEQLVEIGEGIWVEAWARAEQKRMKQEARFKAMEVLDANPDEVTLPSLDEVRKLYAMRLRGFLGMEPVHLVYDEQGKDLHILEQGGACVRILTKSSTLSLKNHSHEWMGTSALKLVPTVEVHETKYPDGSVHKETHTHYTTELDKRFASHFNKALIGFSSALLALGVPLAKSYVFPISFIVPGWSVDAETGVIKWIRSPRPLRGDPSFDVVGFFMTLFKGGRLPLATEQDVRRLLMSIASPLLRGIAPGLLGIYWFMGPPGSGKDFLCDVVLAIWVAAIDYFYPEAGFDLSMTDDLEMKRSFYAAHPAIFARAKEAGKRKFMAERLIQLAGTRAVPARGLYKNEVLISMDFTVLADSAEDLPERKEISRRTVVINVSDMDDAISKGAVLKEITDRAADILAALKALVESRPKEWYLNQTDTHSRPIVPVALAKLLGAALDEVEGRDLGDLFDALYHYVFLDWVEDRDGNPRKLISHEEGMLQRDNARKKDGKEAKLVPNYSYAHFADCASRHDKQGFKSIIKEFPTARVFFNALLRETDYLRVDRGELPYLPVEIGTTSYAFRLFKGRRTFALMEELKYCKLLDIKPIAEEVRATIKGAPPMPQEPAVSPAPPPSPYSFDDEAPAADTAAKVFDA